MNLHRRQFLQAGLAVAGTFALGRGFWQRAYAAPVAIGPGPYGPLLPPDANGLMLPQGFTSRVIATAYSEVMKADGTSTGFVFPRAPDGGGVIPQADGGWIYAINSEIPIVADEFPASTEQGSCSAIRFDAQGRVTAAYSILQGTNNNCAGGVTPWGTWLSCEENFGGFVYECDPTALNQAVRLVGMGQFNHEAAAVDPIGKAIYLTEDAADGAFYRFRPAVWPDEGRPDLTVGTLEVAVVGDDPPVRVPFGSDVAGGLGQVPGIDPDDLPISADIVETLPGTVQWLPVPNPAGLPVGCKDQIPTAAIFKGGEGVWYDDGVVFFTCKGSNRVWSYDTGSNRMDVLYDASILGPDAPLTGVDNLIVHPASHDLFVAEDGGNMEVVLITDETREVAPFLRYPIPHSELTGLAFDPTGTRLYVASQAKRHTVDAATGRTIFGEIIEIGGPFRAASTGGGSSSGSASSSGAVASSASGSTSSSGSSSGSGSGSTSSSSTSGGTTSSSTSGGMTSSSSSASSSGAISSSSGGTAPAPIAPQSPQDATAPGATASPSGRFGGGAMGLGLAALTVAALAKKALADARIEPLPLAEGTADDAAVAEEPPTAV